MKLKPRTDWGVGQKGTTSTKSVTHILPEEDPKNI